MPETTDRGAPQPGARRTPGRGPVNDMGFAVASCALLTAYNNLFGAHPWHSRWYVPVNAGATGAALAAAAASGLTAADIGIGRAAWQPGRLGARLAATVAAGWLLIAMVPATRRVLGDKRIEALDGRGVAYQALVRIPIGTVLWEETAFRGVLQAALRRILPRGAAIAVTSGVFGIWHIRPTYQALRVNGLAGSRAVAGTIAGVTATAAGGVLLSVLRERSGGLAAPALLHLTANCGGPVSVWALRRLNRRAPAPGMSNRHTEMSRAYSGARRGRRIRTVPGHAAGRSDRARCTSLTPQQERTWSGHA